MLPKSWTRANSSVVTAQRTRKFGSNRNGSITAVLYLSAKERKSQRQDIRTPPVVAVRVHSSGGPRSREAARLFQPMWDCFIRLGHRGKGDEMSFLWGVC
jgi:hypothetical protein